MNVTHLSYTQKTNLGSFYTPPHLVRLVYDTLAINIKQAGIDVVLEPACGYGAFFAERFPEQNVRQIGADIDPIALNVARQNLPNVEFHHLNMLYDINRQKYGIHPNDKLAIVGNPPYNDVTSRVKSNIKSEPCEIDNDIRTRDLGLSFMLACAKLKPDYIAVLHPLSYLIKKANFEILMPLMSAYELLDAVVFNSQEFSETSKTTGFPIVAAVYKQNPYGTQYKQILAKRFYTLEGDNFSLSDFDYICNYISKYPSRYPKASYFKFFTMRDINALKRSRTFITEDSENTIYIPTEKLPYYCYIDIFKDIATQLPYYFGNLDVPFDKASFEPLKEDFLCLSAVKHPDIFCDRYYPPEEVAKAKQNITGYFCGLFGMHSENHRQDVISFINVVLNDERNS